MGLETREMMAAALFLSAAYCSNWEEMAAIYRSCSSSASISLREMSDVSPPVTWGLL